jgi:hypothetical protein
MVGFDLMRMGWSTAAKANKLTVQQLKSKLREQILKALTVTKDDPESDVRLAAWLMQTGPTVSIDPSIRSLLQNTAVTDRMRLVGE